jgi:hypothetical protein
MESNDQNSSIIRWNHAFNPIHININPLTKPKHTTRERGVLTDLLGESCAIVVH